MANKIFNVGVATPTTGQMRSIKECSIYVIDLLIKLSKEDDIFNEFTFSTQKWKEEMNINQLGREAAINKFSELTMKKDRGHIKSTYVLPYTLSVDFAWEIGFHFLLDFKKDGKTRFSMTGNVGARDYGGINCYCKI